MVNIKNQKNFLKRNLRISKEEIVNNKRNKLYKKYSPFFKTLMPVQKLSDEYLDAYIRLDKKEK